MTQPELKRFIVACIRAGHDETMERRDDAIELAREGLRRFRARD